MSSFLCFICHSTVNADTNEEIRDKYKEVVGMHLCMDSHLCYICCHVLNKLWLFRAVCLKRSLEYPVLFSEKGTLNLQRNELQFLTICPENCHQYLNRRVYSKSVTFHCEHTVTSQEGIDNEYVDFQEYIQQGNLSTNDKDIQQTNDNEYLNYDEHSSKDEENNSFSRDTEDCEEHFREEPEENEPENEEMNHEDIYYEDKTMFNEYSELQSKEIHDDDKINDSETQNLNLETQNFNLEQHRNLETNTNNEDAFKDVKKKKSKKSKKKGYEKVTLTLEQQKTELERRRKEKKYIEAQFKCYSCALGFLFKDTYQTHMMRHEESNGEHRCTLCSLRFASLPVLRSHTAGHSQRHLCLKCGTTILPRARNTHAKKCWSGKIDVVACHLCAAMFSDSSGLQQHLHRFHRLQRAQSLRCACGVCGHSYASPAALRTHMIKHINRKFNCDQCTSTFSSPYTLTQHKKKHNQPQTEQHYCEICKISYNSRKSLLAHKRNALIHRQSFLQCPLCGRQCSNQRSLAAHIESVHCAANNYACPHCTAHYSNRKSLVRHVATHSRVKEVKKVICHLCGASFKGNNKLNRHLREVCYRKRMEETMEYGQDCMNPA